MLLHTGMKQCQQTDLSTGTPLVMARYSSAWAHGGRLGGAKSPPNTTISAHSVHKDSTFF